LVALEKRDLFKQIALKDSTSLLYRYHKTE